MLVGVFVRNFKLYKNYHFMPLAANGKERFCCIVGPNGAGKSSVLEALDCFFNPDVRDLLVNRNLAPEGSSESPLVAPVFCVPKSKMESLADDEKKILELLSEYFWTVNDSHFGSFMNGFYSVRDQMKASGRSATDYLIVLGRTAASTKSSSFLSFQNQLLKRFSELRLIPGDDSDEEERLESLGSVVKKPLSRVTALYKYFYIPVETDPASYTKLETDEVQALMDEQIRKRVEQLIDDNLLRDINDGLSTYLTDIATKLTRYTYEPSKRKQKLTKVDLVEKVIEAYFATKVLHLKKTTTVKIPVSELSSGEKRRALIDVAHAFLSKRQPNPETYVVIAIDEPDASLHISACYDQFERVREISKQGHQVLIATHWYGFLPAAEDGIGHAIEQQPDGVIRVTSFDLYEYSSSIRRLMSSTNKQIPIDVHLKSYNDLVQSIVASVLHEQPYRWLLCEGVSDKIYLEHFFSLYAKKPESLERLRIVPLGGAKEVKRVYEYLAKPISDDAYQVRGKVVCLVDTDLQMIRYEFAPEAKNLEFRRLLYSETNQKVVLEKANSVNVNPETTIEDCLPTKSFIETLNCFVGSEADLNKIIEKCAQDNCEISGGLNLDKQQRKQLKEFFNSDNGSMKIKFAQKFIEVNREQKLIPEWIKDLRKLLPDFKSE